ncbi:MAG: hypothetical protein ABSH38_14930 [Verrucomicrobiota bacterium]|jgi:ribosomal protein L29
MKEEGRRMKEEVRSGSLQESARFGTIGHAAVVNRERLRVSALAYGSSIVLRFFFFWHDSARFSTIQHDSARFGTIRHDLARFGTIQHDSARFGTIRHDSARFRTIQHDSARFRTIQHDWPCGGRE